MTQETDKTIEQIYTEQGYHCETSFEKNNVVVTVYDKDYETVIDRIVYEYAEPF